MVLIGLTGNIGSGKSTVSAMLKERGATIIDADVVAKQLCEPGEPGWQRIREHFGREVFEQDNRLNRRKLGEIVFADRSKLQLLNSLIHPLVSERIRKLIHESAGRGDREVVIDAPLLIEAGLHVLVDRLWVVVAEDEVRLRRIMERDGLTEEAARLRMWAQEDQSEKVAIADAVIENSGDLEETRRQVARLWNELWNA